MANNELFRRIEIVAVPEQSGSKRCRELLYETGEDADDADILDISNVSPSKKNRTTSLILTESFDDFEVEDKGENLRVVQLTEENTVLKDQVLKMEKNLNQNIVDLKLRLEQNETLESRLKILEELLQNNIAELERRREENSALKDLLKIVEADAKNKQESLKEQRKEKSALKTQLKNLEDTLKKSL